MTPDEFTQSLNSSETIRQDICNENYFLNKPMSVHRLKHKYPQNDIEWGYYLAGLIDADGSFTDIRQNTPNLTICFHLKDISLAYKIKQFLRYGQVTKIKNKQACKYVLTNSKGFKFLLPLLNGKFKHKIKKQRYFLFCRYYGVVLVASRGDKNNNPLSNNHWLAGFIDGDGSLQIKIYQRKNKFEIRLQLQIDQHNDYVYLLKNIKNEFGGNIYQRKMQPSSYYNSTSFQVYKKFINYLEHFQLCSNKYKEYVIWKRAYFYRKDVEKIKKFKKTLIVIITNIWSSPLCGENS